MTEELRCYTWTLYQLSSIQQGIQAGHAAVELVFTHDQHGMVQDWAGGWKTFICLNGGELSDLRDLIAFLDRSDNPLPWVVFHESVESLAGLPTSVAMIVPARIFEAANEFRAGNIADDASNFTDWEWELVRRIAGSPKAR